MRPPTPKERSALLEAAFDSGIRHFDTARYYGHGGSEAVLGKFLSDNYLRDQVTITTKFGIEPPSLGSSSVGKRMINTARRLATIHPGVRKLLSGFAGRGVRMNRFDPESARLSLETSLRELRTDHVDVFLLHEASLESAQTPGLLEFLEGAKRSGKVRVFGCASELPSTLDIITGAPAFASVVQIANGLGHWNLQKLPSHPERFVLTHGALKILPALENASSQSTLVTEGKDVGLFLSARGSELAGLVLGLALHKNSQGVTLFSSTQPQRIRENIEKAIRWNSLTVNDWSAFQCGAEQYLATAHVR
jgi:diketogulonate reductase-like aldo/keto reductase